MSVFIYTHRHPLRTYQEFFAKVMYFLIGCTMLTALLVTFTLWVGRVNNVFEDYWSTGDYQLTTRVTTLITPVDPTVVAPPAFNVQKIKVGGKHVAIGTNASNAAFLMATVTDMQNLVFATAWPAVILSLINKLLFRLNWWHLRYRGFIVRTNIILPTLEVFFHVWAIVAISRTFGPCDYVSDYIDYILMYAKQQGSQVDQVDHNFDISFVALLVVLCLNLGAIALGLLRLACDACDDGNTQWAEVRYVDFHRKAQKGTSGHLGEDANDEIVPPKRAILRVLREYPDILREYESSLERRFDPADGALYTKDEFVDHYGGTSQWDHAQSALGNTCTTYQAGLGDTHSDMKYSPAIGPSTPALDNHEPDDERIAAEIDSHFATTHHSIMSNPPKLGDVL